MAPKPKLTLQQIGELRAFAKANPELTETELGEKFGVGRTTVNAALKTAEAETAAPLDMLMLSTAQILTSSLNPRKTFDDEAIAELAASIAANGLLQNLVVRPAKNGFYQIVAGERRFRAIRYLEERNQWNAPFACRLITADDGAHLALALLENLARVDVPPMEEAEAFVQLQALDTAVWTTAGIAQKIGKSVRYVQQRLSLAAKLCPAAKHALADRLITIEGARLLTTVSHEIQTDILDRADGKVSTSDIEYELRGTLMEVDDAIFDVPAAGLETIELDGDDFFIDSKAAHALQMKAVEAKAKELKKKWAFVKVLKPGEYFESHKYVQGKTKAQGGGVIISISKPYYMVMIREGWMEKPKATPAPPLKPREAMPPEPQPAPAANGVRLATPDPVLAAEPDFTLQRLLDFRQPPGVSAELFDVVFDALENLVAEAMPSNWQEGDDITAMASETDAWRQALEAICAVKKIPVPSWVAAKEAA